MAYLSLRLTPTETYYSLLEWTNPQVQFCHFIEVFSIGVIRVRNVVVTDKPIIGHLNKKVNHIFYKNLLTSYPHFHKSYPQVIKPAIVYLLPHAKTIKHQVFKLVLYCGSQDLLPGDSGFRVADNSKPY